VPLDNVAWDLSVSDSILAVEFLRGSGREIRSYAEGTFGLGADRDGLLTGFLETDSLGVLEPFLATLFGVLPDERVFGAPRPSGVIKSYFEVTGSSSDFTASVAFEGHRLDRGSVFVDSVQSSASWHSANREARLQVSLDSLELGRWAFQDIQLGFTGPTDSLHWFARTRFGADGWGAAIAWGHPFPTETGGSCH
jgi:hypothetical protein